MTDASKAGAALVVLAAFVLGIVAGAAVLHIARLSIGPPPPRHGPLPPPGPGPGPLGPPVERLARELDLDDAQIERLREILEASRGRIREEADATREHIREILSPDQRERFDRLGPPPPREPGFWPPGGRSRPR